MIKLDSVSKEYRRGASVVVAVRGIALEVAKGEFCALMGPSGCGKSTLLNLVAGLDHPTSGDILLEGRSTKTFSDKEWTRVRRSLIGMVFQSFHLLPTLTAEENVALPLLLQGERSPVVRRRVTEGLEAVGMAHRAMHLPGELSGGEQQRVAIARALIHQPRLILADEPTGNLDSSSGAAIIALLKSLSKSRGQSVLMVTHNQEASREADRVHMMKDGQVENGSL